MRSCKSITRDGDAIDSSPPDDVIASLIFFYHFTSSNGVYRNVKSMQLEIKVPIDSSNWILIAELLSDRQSRHKILLTSNAKRTGDVRHIRWDFWIFPTCALCNVFITHTSSGYSTAYQTAAVVWVRHKYLKRLFFLCSFELGLLLIAGG